MKRLRPSFKPAAMWLVLITVLLCMPGSALPAQDWMSHVRIDKWVHIALFSGLVVLLCFGITSLEKRVSRMRSAFVIAAALSLAYGVALEFIQSNFIPHRSFDVWDIAADAIGSTLALLFSIRYFSD